MGKTLYELLTDKEREEIISMYQNNISLREIEKITGHGRTRVAKMLENLGIKTTSGNHYRKYFFDFDFFETIDTELKAYWLGFLYADGCILPINKYGEQEFKLALAEQDKQSIIDFKNDLQSTYPIRIDSSRHNKNSTHQIQYLISMRSQKTVNDLKKLGCIEKKSLTLTFPNELQVPPSLIHHFIRGYFDGDGSISITTTQNNNIHYQVSFVGTELFIKELYNYFNIGSILPDKRKINSWYLNIGGKNQVIQVYNFMYQNATRYMERKYQKFQQIL